MYLMYVDESGDCGLSDSRTDYFCLSGIVIHESRWKEILDEFIKFKRSLMGKYGLKYREEIHSTKLFNRPGSLKRIPQHLRIDLYKQSVHFISNLQYLRIINVIINKRRYVSRKSNATANEVFEVTWNRILQRFENTIKYRNFPDANSERDDKGMIIPDQTDTKRLTILLRKMRRFNFIPNDRTVFGDGSRRIELNYIIEDPFFKDSSKSLFHQLADVCSYTLYQKYNCNSNFRKKIGNPDNFFSGLSPVLLKEASRKRNDGIVEI